MTRDTDGTAVTHLTVDGEGRLEVPRHVARRFGLVPGARVRLEEIGHDLVLHRPTSSLARVYVEPTTECSLACRDCIRHAWNEPGGRMSEAAFARLLDGIARVDPVPSVFFGGYGEPLAHPRIVSMVGRARNLGARVELITNGLALDGPVCEGLVDAGLETLWVSLDGATPECYGELRDAGDFPRLVESLRGLQLLKWRRDTEFPRLGVAFVATRRTQAALADVLRLGLRLGATRFSASNLQPHTAELEREVLYARSLGEKPSAYATLDLPRMDPGHAWDRLLVGVLDDCGLRLDRGRASARRADACPFVEKGSLSVRWDGAVSPCLPLLHTHEVFAGGRRRTISAHAFATILERDLDDIWNAPGYAALRERVAAFDFPPCLLCNSCEWMDGNREDCFGNPPPTCGGCLWAQGYLVCP